MSLIFLNGTTSAGKAGIARALQDQLARPYCVTGIDDAFAMLPDRLHNNRAFSSRVESPGDSENAVKQ